MTMIHLSDLSLEYYYAFVLKVICTQCVHATISEPVFPVLLCRFVQDLSVNPSPVYKDGSSILLSGRTNKGDPGSVFHITSRDGKLVWSCGGDGYVKLIDYGSVLDSKNEAMMK
jgi:hypothetical protein